ncbi:MAG: hypothetical protein WCA19_26270 [Candidatus Acidiferrales bacterium]
MKTKVARKTTHHAKPFRKVARGKKQARAAETINKKETIQTAPAEPEMVVATFETPVEFVEFDLEPEVEVIEVFEFAVPGGEGRA